MIDVTGVDLVKLAKKAYDLSQSQGLGFLHFTTDPLSDEEAKKLIRADSRFVLSMDCVKGRAVKLRVLKNENRLEIPDTWYDHTYGQYRELLEFVGIDPPKTGQEHGVDCSCYFCEMRSRRGSGR